MLPLELCWQTPARTLHPAWRLVGASCGGKEEKTKQNVALIISERTETL